MGFVRTTRVRGQESRKDYVVKQSPKKKKGTDAGTAEEEAAKEDTVETPAENPSA